MIKITLKDYKWITIYSWNITWISWEGINFKCQMLLIFCHCKFLLICRVFIQCLYTPLRASYLQNLVICLIRYQSFYIKQKDNFNFLQYSLYKTCFNVVYKWAVKSDMSVKDLLRKSGQDLSPDHMVKSKFHIKL